MAGELNAIFAHHRLMSMQRDHGVLSAGSLHESRSIAGYPREGRRLRRPGVSRDPPAWVRARRKYWSPFLLTSITTLIVE